MSIIDHRDKLYFAMLRTPFEHVRQAFVQRSRVEHDRVDDTAMWMADRGYELVDAPEGSLITDDGREIIHVFGTAWALRAEVHTARLQAALAGGQRAKPAVPGEGLASVLCPACRSIMAKSPVCPNCSKGRQGYKILCICSECNHEVYL